MKKMLLLLFIAMSFQSYAQINKGQWLLGGNAAFSYSKYQYQKTTSLQLTPDAGYFFLDKLTGGLRVGYETNRYNYFNGSKYNNSSLFISPFLRYYFLPTEQKVNVFADAGYGFGWYKYKDFINSRSETYTYHRFSAMVGTAIFLNQYIALEMTLGYKYSPSSAIDTIAKSQFQAGFGLQIHLGKSK